MGVKVTFNEITKVIEIDEAPDGNGDVLIDVKVDLYSDGKEDWVTTESLRKFYFPISAEGGKPLPGEKDLGSTFFLASDWKIRPYDSDHRLIIDGNLYSVDGSDPFIDTITDYSVRIMQQVSDLVSTVESGSGVTDQDKLDIADQVWDEDLSTHSVPKSSSTALRGGTYQIGTLIFDSVLGSAGTGWPIGTTYQPSDNLTDALTIMLFGKTKDLVLQSDLTVEASHDISGLLVRSIGLMGTDVILNPGCTVNQTTFRNLNLSGEITSGNEILIYDCSIGSLINFRGIMNNVAFSQSAEIVLDTWATIIQATCGGDPTNEAEISIGTASLNMSNWSGNLKLKDKTGLNRTVINCDSGNIIIDATCVAGIIQILGTGTIEADNSGAGCLVDIDGFISIENVADATWDEETADHKIAGTFGNELATKADLAASASTDYDIAISGLVIEGSEDAGTFGSTQIRDNNYWQIGEDGTNGLIVELIFNIPDGNKAGSIYAFGRYVGVPSSTHFLNLLAYDYEAVGWEILSTEFMPGGITSDDEFIHEYYERNIDRSNNNEVKIRLVHNVTTYNASHSAYLDLINVSSIEIVTAEDIADAVWLHTTGMKVLGLVQENFVMDQQIYQDYNGAKLLTSARIRTYQDSAKTQLIATYAITATWSGASCTSYQMVIV